MLPTLAASSLVPTRAAVASRADCPPFTLAILARDPDWFVRLSVAAHPATPPDILRLLSVDPDLDVQRTVRDNPSTPPPLRLRLALTLS